MVIGLNVMQRVNKIEHGKLPPLFKTNTWVALSATKTWMLVKPEIAKLIVNGVNGEIGLNAPRMGLRGDLEVKVIKKASY